MRNFAIYTAACAFPIIILGNKQCPSELLIAGANKRCIKGLALKMNGEPLQEPVTVEVPFDSIARIAISTSEQENSQCY